MNHKAGKPRKSRHRCHMCKFWKERGNGRERRPVHEQARRDAMREEIG